MAKNIENEILPSEKEKLSEDFSTINESVERIRKFVEELINLKTAETEDYTSDQKMIRTN